MITQAKRNRDLGALAAYPAAEALADWRLTDSERRDAKEGRRAGKVSAARIAAVEMIRHAAERRAFEPGYAIDPGSIADDYSVTALPSNLAEARWIVDAAEMAAAKSKRGMGAYRSMADPRRMTASDIGSIAYGGAIRAARHASTYGRRLRSEELAELVTDTALSVIEHGAKCEPIGFTGAPRWAVILRDATDSADAATMRQRWTDLAFNSARRIVRANRERELAESGADDDAAIIEAHADATAADFARVSGTLDGILANVPFSGAERDAIRCAFTPNRLIELAAELDRTPNALMANASRGRKALAERWPTPKDARAELAALPALQRERQLREALAGVRPLMSPAVPIYRGAKLSWPQVRAVEPSPVTVRAAS